jgi:hypothetical protein
MRGVGLLPLAAVAGALICPAQAQEDASTTRIEPRPIYGAVVTCRARSACLSARASDHALDCQPGGGPNDVEHRRPCGHLWVLAPLTQVARQPDYHSG